MMFTTLISSLELQQQLDNPNLRIFDVRHDLMRPLAGQIAFDTAHIPGAQFLRIETELSGAHTGKNGRHPLPDKAQFIQTLQKFDVHPNSQVIIYDAQNNQFAARLWWMLRWVGHQAVAVLDGGWPAWCQAQLDIEFMANDSPKSGTITIQDSLVDTVNVEEVLTNLDSAELLVVDARAHARYLGQTEPLDPVAGHIPGAVNRPLSDNLLENGQFKPADQLKAEFQRLIGPYQPQQVVHQCGSGITACHNLLAMEIAGLTGAKLYPGSWSEWCSNPQRPTASINT